MHTCNSVILPFIKLSLNFYFKRGKEVYQYKQIQIKFNGSQS